jgi:GcrA cell cycle regulator
MTEKQTVRFKFWSDERTAMLRRMWWDGASMSDCMNVLGASRHSVSGKIEREKFARNPDLARTKPPPNLNPVPKKMLAPAPFPLKRDGAPITIGNVKDGECKWILIEEPRADAPMCGHPAVSGKPWCPYHLERAGG